MKTFQEKIEDLVALITEHKGRDRNETIASLNAFAKRDGFLQYEVAQAETLKKYVRISIKNPQCNSSHVSYFVDIATQEIFGSKSWQTPNFARKYGTLDTINDWNWQEYYAESLTGVNTLVPKGKRRK